MSDGIFLTEIPKELEPPELKTFAIVVNVVDHLSLIRSTLKWIYKLFEDNNLVLFHIWRLCKSS